MVYLPLCSILDADFTLLIQLAIFLVFFFTLHFLVFKPYLKIYQLRRSKTTGLLEEVGGLQDRIEEFTTRYQKLYDEILQQGRAQKEELKKEGLAEAEIILGEGKQRAVTLKTDQLKVIEQEFHRSRRQVRTAIDELKNFLINRIKA